MLNTVQRFWKSGKIKAGQQCNREETCKETVCAHACVCVRACAYVCLHMHVCVGVRVCVSEHVYVWVCMCVHARVSVNVRLCVHMCVWALMCVWACVCACVHEWVSAHACVWECACVCESVHVCVRACMCASMRVCERACVCARVRVCVWKRRRKRGSRKERKAVERDSSQQFFSKVLKRFKHSLSPHPPILQRFPFSPLPPCSLPLITWKRIAEGRNASWFSDRTAVAAFRDFTSKELNTETLGTLPIPSPPLTSHLPGILPLLLLPTPHNLKKQRHLKASYGEGCCEEINKNTDFESNIIALETHALTYGISFSFHTLTRHFWNS